MQLLAVGLNHMTAPLDLREKVAFPADQIGQAVSAARQWFGQSREAGLLTGLSDEADGVLPQAARIRHDIKITSDLRIRNSIYRYWLDSGLALPTRPHAGASGDGVRRWLVGRRAGAARGPRG